MNSLVAPPNQNNGSASDGGDVDRILRAFFRAEMPDPWPSFAAPRTKPAVIPFRPLAPRRPILSRTRLALAASVALFISGAWLMSGKFNDPSPGETIPTIGPGSARHLNPDEDLPGKAKISDPFIELNKEGETQLKTVIEFPDLPSR